MYEIDGVPLSDPQGRWRLHRETQRRTPVTMRAVEATVPGLDGALPIYGEAVEPTALGLELSVYGTEEQIEERCAFLRGLLGKTHAPLLVSRRDGLTAEAKPAAITDPVMTACYARIAATLTIPSGVWRGGEQTWTAPTLTGASEVSTLAGGTRAVTDALVLVQGPVSDLALTDTATGAQLRYTGAVPDGQRLLIDCAGWSAAEGAVTWGTTWRNRTQLLEATGTRSDVHLWTLTPTATPAGTTQTSITVSATGTTESSGLQIRARPAHL